MSINTKWPNMKMSSGFIKKEKKKADLIKLIKAIKISLLLKRTWQAKFISAKYSTVLKIRNEAVTVAFLGELRTIKTNREAQIKKKH